ncbi:MAG: hypothetical protein HC769_11925 [Cyanobacteria bacterium CRU_2_1]|nr:hypothetical protein [Cyanobacteria bacterium CRU_2_1]
MKHVEVESSGLKALLLVGLMATVGVLLLDVSQIRLPQSTRYQAEICEGQINPDVVISREQLAQFLTISERDTRARVQDILLVPYCQLPDLEVRAGVVAERSVYPLAFDPQTWLIVLYEGDEYAGYQFLFQQL